MDNGTLLTKALEASMKERRELLAERERSLVSPPYAKHGHHAFDYGATSFGVTRANRTPDRFTGVAMRSMICSRMGWGGYDPASDTEGTIPFREMHCAKLNDEKAVVFIVHGETPLQIEDDLHLFPSDALITSLRLLIG